MFRWYVINTYSGHEKKVKANLEHRIDSMEMKNKMDITMNIAIGSSTQIAMFVAPVLVFASLLLGHPITYIFTVPELTAIGFSVIITAFIAGDGKCHWLEGAQLLAAYAIIALAFYFLPPG